MENNVLKMPQTDTPSHYATSENVHKSKLRLNLYYNKISTHDNDMMYVTKFNLNKGIVGTWAILYFKLEKSEQ